MIYQNPYQNIRTADIYGARKQAAQDKQTAQDNALILEQKQLKLAQDKATQAYKIGASFKNLTPERQAAQWNTTRQQLEVVYPEMKGKFPSSWDSDQAGNVAQLDLFLSKMSPLVSPERVTLREGDVIQERMPGEQFKTIASGMPKKADAPFKMVEIKIGDTTYRIPEGTLPSGSILSGNFVQDINQRMKAVPIEDYFAKNPSDYPGTAQVISGGIDAKPSVNSLATPPAAPVAVPGQTELPPRQFNAPSPNNRAGETNVGYPIDENAMLQQPQIMPSMGNMMLKGAGAVMADEFAPQPRNALVGGMMPQPSQFAELMPAGSAPNRFGSPGVEGMDFAATGGRPKVEIVNGVVTYTAPPKPGQERVTARDMTAAEISASGRDPARFSGQILSTGEKKYDAIPSKAAAELEQSQADKAKADATKAQIELQREQRQAKKDQGDAVSLLRGLKRIDTALGSLQSNPFFDTGTFDQYFMAKTNKGKELDASNKAILATVKRLTRTPGEGAFSNLDVGLLEGQLPKMEYDMETNRNNLKQILVDALYAYGVQAAVSNKKERDALPPGTTYVDTNTGMRYQKGEK